MHVAAFLRDRPADAQREAAEWTTSCGALLEMPQVLGSEGSSSCCVVESVGLRRARSARRLHFFSSLAAFVLFSATLIRVIIAHAHAARRDVTRWAVTTAIETVAVIATGGRPIARRAATSGGVVAAPRDAAQLRETEVAAGWRPRRGGVVTPRRVLLWR